MVETIGILVLCVIGLVCVVVPSLAVLAFVAWIFADLGWL